MKNKKKITVIFIFFIIITFLTSLYIWSFIMNSKEQSKQSHLSFSYLRAGEIEPEELTNDIMKAIGHPNAIPIVSMEDNFRVVLYNSPKETNLELYSFNGRFRFIVSGIDKVQELSYEFQLQNHELVIIDITGTGDEKLSNDQATTFRLTDVFSAIRDFPIESYREFTKYGNEKTDLYGLTLNDSYPLLYVDDFSYDKNGYIQKNENKNGIPLLITHLKWGEIRDDTLNYDDPRRYYNFGGEGRANLFYIPE